MDIYITCRNCGEKFVFADSEQAFYKSKNLTPPRRCKVCRNLKKTDENVGDILKLGYKKSSYLDNAQLYGPGVSVAGGLSTEYRYIIKVQLQGEIFYVNFDKENGKICKVKNIENAKTYVWSSDLKEIQEFLQKKYSEGKVVLDPMSYYMHLRD